MEDNTAILQKLEEYYLKEKEQVQSALEAGILGAKEAPYGFKMPWQQCFKNMKEDEARFQELAAKAITYGECYQLDLLGGPGRPYTRITENMMGKGSEIIGLIEILYRNNYSQDIDQICSLIESKVGICKELDIPMDTVKIGYKQAGGFTTKGEQDSGCRSLAHYATVVEDYRSQFKIAMQNKKEILATEHNYDQCIIGGWSPKYPSDPNNKIAMETFNQQQRKYDTRVKQLRAMGWYGCHMPTVQPNFETNLRSADQVHNQTSKESQKTLPKYESTIFSTRKDIGSVFQWLRMFERLCTSNDITTDSRKIKWLAKALDPNDAMLWNWYNKIDSVDTAWSRMKEDFVLQFAPAHERSPAEIWNRIMLVPKNTRETIRNFGSSFQAALDNLEAANSIAIEPLQPTTTQICRAWLKCVGDKALSNTFSSQITPGVDFANFMAQTTVWKENNDAVAASMKGNMHLMHPLNTVTAGMPRLPGQPTSNLRSGIRPPVPNTGRPHNSVASKPAAAANGQKDTKNIQDEIDALTSNLNALHIKLGQKNTGYTGPQSGTPNSRSCYRCGKEGHLARECTVDRTEVLPTYRGFKLEAATYDLPDDDDWYNPELEDYYMDYYTWMMRDNQYEQDFQQGC
jgi:hypothetical protein